MIHFYDSPFSHTIHKNRSVSRVPSRKVRFARSRMSTSYARLLGIELFRGYESRVGTLTHRYFRMTNKSCDSFLVSARTDQFSYQPSLLNAPDLPSWIHYTYSKRDHHGFLYGVAPKDRKYFQVIHRGEMSDTCFKLSLLFNHVTFKFNILFFHRKLRLILLLIVV